MKPRDAPDILREYTRLPLAMHKRDGHAYRARYAVWCLTSPLIALCKSTDVGRRTGIYLTVISFRSLAGPPISIALRASTQSSGFMHWQVDSPFL